MLLSSVLQAQSTLHYFKAPMEVRERRIECDVAAYGGTPAGIGAAIQAVRDGKSAVLLTFNGFVGGLSSGGLSSTDIGKKDSIGGMALEFYEKVGSLVGFRAMDAEKTFRAMLREAGVQVFERQHLKEVKMKGEHITEIHMLDGTVVAAKVFVDGTYEGDLMAAANISYQVGREPRSAYQESLAGQWQTVSWKGVYQFCDLPISPYRIPGDRSSGLLPEISAEPCGAPGDGDFRIQAYNFRMILSNKEGAIPFPKPAAYDRDRYALLGRFLNFDPQPKWVLNYTTQPMTDGPVQMRNGDSNNAGSFSSDYVGGSNLWPDGSYKAENHKELQPSRRGLPVPLPELYRKREAIYQDHVNYQQGLMYYLANDKDVPEELQQRVRKFGLDPNEFAQSGHWPHALYVREGRRMVSDYVMTQADCEFTRVAKDSIGLASYPMDSHFCQRVAVEIDGKTTVRNEGGFGHHCAGAYPVAYRSIVPKKTECTNLLVPLCLSASHVAYGSIRMEPVFMILGQSAGAAAAMAIDNKQAVQEVDYPSLRKHLQKLGQKLDAIPAKK